MSAADSFTRLNAALEDRYRIERFLAEIQTTANLNHPHILPLHDSGEADSFLYFVMPYVEGETLRDRLAREKQLPVEEAVTILVASCAPWLTTRFAVSVGVGTDSSTTGRPPATSAVCQPV